MAIGMTYDQYWYGDALMKRSFLKAHQLWKRRQDEEAWWQGLYILSALKATVGNLFMEEGDEPNRYPERPLLEEKNRKKAEEREQERKAKEEERERLRLVAYLNQVMMARKQ